MYGPDLARIHEDAFTWVAEAAARELLEHVRGHVVDLGCGGGTLARALVDAGCTVEGVDLSPHMVALACDRVPEARFHVGDVLAHPIGPCDAVTAVGEVLNYAVQSPVDLLPLFRRVADALRPDGVFLFDIATPERDTGHTAREGPGWCIEATSSITGDFLERTLDTWVEGRHTHEVHRQRLLEPAAVEGALAEAGFEAERLGSYDDVMLERGWEAFLARPIGA